MAKKAKTAKSTPDRGWFASMDAAGRLWKKNKSGKRSKNVGVKKTKTASKKTTKGLTGLKRKKRTTTRKRTTRRSK